MNQKRYIGHLFYNNRLTGLVLIAALLAVSCTEKINLKLNSTGTHIVIEGNITDQPGPYTVHVSNSLNYYDNNNFPGVSGATVVVTDDAGNTDTLQEQPTKAGYYQTGGSFQGTSGRTYFLSVLSNGTLYSSNSKMPDPVRIDTLYTQTLSIFGQSGIILYCLYPDPVNQTNYYRITTYQDTITGGEDRAYSDQFSNGNEQNTFVSTTNSLNKGDSIQVILQGIDQPVYTYFSSLRSNTNTSSAAPANPISNITNGALGYFSACTRTSKRIFIK